MSEIEKLENRVYNLPKKILPSFRIGLTKWKTNAGLSKLNPISRPGNLIA
jgi:hypothetical protein